MSVARGTVHSVQFLRFVAATLVVVFHAHQAIARALGGADPAEMYLFGFGAVGVHIFFVISGYIMYLTNFGRGQPYSAKRFYARRLIRIYPTYWIFVAIYLLVEAALAILPSLSPGQFLGALVLWPPDAPRVIGPAWTLSYELYFYAVFGLTMTLGARRGVVTLTSVFLACIALGLALRPQSVAASVATNGLLMEFLAGVWIARITTTAVLPRPVGLLGLVGGLALFALGLLWGYDRLPSAAVWGGPSALLVAGAVVLEQTARPGGRPGSVRRLSVLGDSSYSLYLCHILLVTCAVRLMGVVGLTGGRLAAVLLTTLTCIAAAHLFFLTIERPIVGRLHRWTERRRPPNRPAQAGAAAS